MARAHHRKSVLAGVALVAAAALMTACQSTPEPEGAGAAPSAESGGSAPEEGAAAKAGPEQPAGEQAPEEQAAAEQAPEEQAAGKAEGKEVSGTWLGSVSYVAPGKYTVSDMKDKQQMFYLAESTVILGTGDICGEQDASPAQKCTSAELEAAAKKGVSAKVELKSGVATSIVDDN